jgi:hypothetical protein
MVLYHRALIGTYRDRLRAASGRSGGAGDAVYRQAFTTPSEAAPCGHFRMASRTPNDTPYRVGARSYPKAPAWRLYRFLLTLGGIMEAFTDAVGLW